MIGNDIVDLKQAAQDSNWQRPRFLDKIFTQNEKNLIYTSKNQPQMVWQLWSMKESVYKIAIQEGAQRLFLPTKLSCSLTNEKEGWVYFNGKTYATKSHLSVDFISTFAFSGDDKSVLHRYFKIQRSSSISQSAELRKVFLESYAEQKNRPIIDLSVKKDRNEIPRLFYKDKQQKDSFSFAHHGRYCAFAIEI